MTTKSFIIITITFTSLLTLLSCNNKSPTENDGFIPVMPFGNIIDVQPDWSPDGETIAYNHHVDKIYLLDLASMEKHFLTPGAHPDWSPDGTKIAYELQGNIYVIDVETKEITQLTDWGECFFPSWSPDGKKIAFDTNYGDAKGANAIWIMDADGSNKKDISQHGTGEWREPAWSPDGSQILHSRYLTDVQFTELFLMDTLGTNRKRLTYNSFIDAHASWSPDGSKIAWTSGSGNDPASGIWIMNVDGSNPHLIAQWGTHPSWSPDGTEIVYTGYNEDSETTTLWRMNADGTNQRPLTTP